MKLGADNRRHSSPTLTGDASIDSTDARPLHNDDSTPTQFIAQRKNQYKFQSNRTFACV